MIPIKIKQNFTYNGNYYIAGKEITDKLPMEIINKLNEKGYIEPLSIEDLIQYEKEATKPKNKEVK